MRLALIMMTMLAAPALAAESSELSGASLIEDCLAYVEDPSSERGRLCSVFISGFIVNAIIAVLLTFIGDRLGLDLYLVALLAFGLRIFDNVALIRRHFL